MPNTMGHSGEIKAKPAFQPSLYQQGMADWVVANLGQGRHAIIQACAGSGKTTSSVWIFTDYLPKDIPVVFVAFNSHIAAELSTRLPDGANARTYHSLGLATLRQNVPSIQVNQDKVENYLKALHTEKWMIPSTKKLVGVCKSGIDYDFTDADLERLAFTHDIDLYDDKGSTFAKERIFGLTRRVLDFSMNNPEVVDFDDMIWLPNVLDGMSYMQFDFILGDEFQDTNRAQMELVLKSISPNGNIVGVGDRWQSIYAFRGASSTAMDDLKNRLDADELPLSLSYRCPVAVGQLVNERFPHIRFELPEWARPGKVCDMLERDVEKIIQPDDMVLCRVNADLVPVAFSLIRNGIKATIKGRDIGKGLVSLIRKSKADDVNGLMSWLNDWKSKEMTKALLLGSDSKISSIQDRVETIEALSDGADTIAQVIGRCEDLFSDEKSAVTLSTIHKAKGLEADRVFILRPDLLPHPAAKKDEAKRQESNLEYVACTRSLNELIFVR